MRPHPTNSISEQAMVAALRDLRIGSPLVLIYSKAGRDTASTVASRAQSDAAGLAPNVYVGFYAGMVAGGQKQVCAKMLCANRGGELRTFNPSVGALHAILPGAAFVTAFGFPVVSIANTLPAEALRAA